MTIDSPPVDHGSDPTADELTETPTEQPEPTPEVPAEDPPELPAPAAPEPPRSLLRQISTGYDGPADMDGQIRHATFLSKAVTSVPSSYFGRPADIYAVIQHARALDLPVMIALNGLYFHDDGKVGIAGIMMHGLVIRAGHHIHVLRDDDRMVVMRLVRGDGGPSYTAKWTLLEAHRQGLVGMNEFWSRTPGDMLWWRCVGRVSRRGAPEVTLGFYAIEELQGGGAVVDPRSAEMDGTVLDIDGNPTPAPDVMELLADLDSLTPEQIRELMKTASERGLMSRYAGTIDGIRYTVEEILFDKGYAADVKAGDQRRTTARAMAAVAAGRKSGDDTPPAEVASASSVTPPLEAAGEQPAATAEESLAGTGGPLVCGCDPAVVVATGNHQEGCSKHVG